MMILIEYPKSENRVIALSKFIDKLDDDELFELFEFLINHKKFGLYFEE